MFSTKTEDLSAQCGIAFTILALWNLQFKFGTRDGEEGFQGALKVPLGQVMFLRPNSDQ